MSGVPRKKGILLSYYLLGTLTSGHYLVDCAWQRGGWDHSKQVLPLADPLIVKKIARCAGLMAVVVLLSPLQLTW